MLLTCSWARFSQHFQCYLYPVQPLTTSLASPSLFRLLQLSVWKPPPFNSNNHNSCSAILAAAELQRLVALKLVVFDRRASRQPPLPEFSALSANSLICRTCSLLRRVTIYGFTLETISCLLQSLSGSYISSEQILQMLIGDN